MTMHRRLWLVLAFIGAPLAAQAQEADTPLRQVHTISVFTNVEGEPFFEVLGQDEPQSARLLAGGTLVVEATGQDSLQVMVYLGTDGLVPATDGANAVALAPAFPIQALRARSLRDRARPEGSTFHDVLIVVCAATDETNACISWTPARPNLRDGAPPVLTLEIVDDASRALLPTGRVRADDD